MLHMKTQTCVVGLVLARGADAKDVEHLLVIPLSVSMQEAIRRVHVLLQRAQPVRRRLLCSIAGEDEDLESTVGRQQVVDVHGSCIGCIHEGVWDHALAYHEVGRARLVLAARDGGGFVTDADAGGEAAELPDSSTRRGKL